MTSSVAPVQVPAAVTPDPVRLRRRPILVTVGILLTVTASATAGWAVLHAQDTVRVLAVARPVSAGHQITSRDLTVLDLAANSTSSVLAAGDAKQAVGRYATVSLLPGQLLLRESLSDEVLPAAGSALVAVTVPSSRMPAVALEAGDRVLVVSTPADQEDPPHADVPDSLVALVVSTQPLPDTDQIVVTVQIEQARAALLAARAATGRIAIAVLTRAQ
jgi:hypothetical protein